MIIDKINSGRPRFSRMAVLNNFFTGPRPIALPQNEEKLYKYKIGQTVRFELSKNQRHWPYKFSLAYGTVQI